MAVTRVVAPTEGEEIQALVAAVARAEGELELGAEELDWGRDLPVQGCGIGLWRGRGGRAPRDHCQIARHCSAALADNVPQDLLDMDPLPTLAASEIERGG